MLPSEDVQAVIDAVRKATVDAVRESNAGLEQRLAVMQSKQEEILRGFPDSDPDSHRRYHESVMEWRELRNKMVREALIQAAKVGGVGAIGWLAYALWISLKMEIFK